MATVDPTTKFTKNASATVDSLQEDFSAMRDDIGKLSQQVVDLLQAKGNMAYKSARKQFKLGNEDGKIVWWWRRLTLMALKK